MLKKICSCKNKHGFWHTECGYGLYYTPIFLIVIILWCIFAFPLGLFGSQFIKLDNINCNSFANKEMMLDCFAIGNITLLILLLIIGLIIGTYQIYKNGYMILTTQIIAIIITIYITSMIIGNFLCKFSQEILNIKAHTEPFYHIKYFAIGFMAIVGISSITYLFALMCCELFGACRTIYNKNKEILEDEYSKRI